MKSPKNHFLTFLMFGIASYAPEPNGYIPLSDERPAVRSSCGRTVKAIAIATAVMLVGCDLFREKKFWSV